MNKQKIDYIVDTLMGIAFFITAATGLIMFFFLPYGVQQGRFQEFAGIIKSTWITWHNWAGIVMTSLVLLHLLLHWRWMVYMTKNLFSKGKACNKSR